jgi:hypothetical protein
MNKIIGWAIRLLNTVLTGLSFLWVITNQSYFLLATPFMWLGYLMLDDLIEIYFFKKKRCSTTSKEL